MIKTEWLRSKIGRRFALYSIFIGAIMAMVLSFLISYQQYQDRISFLEKELNTIVTANQSFIEQSLWILDTPALGLVIKGFLLNNDITFAQITDENGKVIVSDGVLDAEHSIKKTVPLYYQDEGKKVFLGELTVGASKLSALKSAESLVFITFFQSILLMLLLSIAIIFTFWHLVSKHLIAIQKYTKNITFVGQQKPLVLERSMRGYAKDDELASAVDAINLLYGKVMKTFRKLELETAEKIKLEQQFLHIQKMESIGQLAAGIAHDFNNVLSVIMGYSYLLLSTIPPDDPAYKRIQRIHDAGDRAATLTRQLLAFSRKQVLEKKVVSINTIIGNFLKILGKMAGEDIVITTCLSEKDCVVDADPGQIEQVIMNLVVNARDAMPKGGEIIIETEETQLDQNYVSKHVEAKPGQYVLMTVSDTGEGMDKDILAKIFDPFFTTKESGKGTGLGLATVYGIVKQHGGYIYAYSEKGKGTTFKIYLPASKKAEEGVEDKASSKALFGGNETILIVDDNTSICQFIVETLKPLGYNCLEASSGQEALQLLHQYQGTIQLLLTDVVMPGMSGRQLAETIRKERPEVKVLFMSGYTENIITHHGVLEEGVNYISKPITPVALTQKIRVILDNH